jgi:hypothetical protein
MFNPFARHRLRGLLAVVLALCSVSAHALPSYARQTGEECAACHIGGFGPQLTPHGQKFKIGGYSEGKYAEWYVPLSAHVIAGYDNTAKGQDAPPADHFKNNDNILVQEASVFVAGKIGEHAGTFSQVTLDGVAQHVGWDSVDVRYARELKISGQDATVGVSLNNKPTTQDPFNTLGQWAYPYTNAALGFGPYSASQLQPDGSGFDGYKLYGNVLGLTAYALLADSIYLEAGGYQKLKGPTLSRLGQGKDSELAMTGITPYWRAAYTKDLHRQNFSIGVIGMDSVFSPSDGAGLKDRFHDIGVDASYQFLGTRKHIVTVNAAWLRERQALDYTQSQGGSDALRQTLYSYNLNAAYFFRNTYGLTFGQFSSHGHADESLYPDSRLYRPDTTGHFAELSWTPNGKEASQLPVWLNFRLGLQYTAFSKFQGSSNDYDGNGRKAADNNTTFLYLWTAL